MERHLLPEKKCPIHNRRIFRRTMRVLSPKEKTIIGQIDLTDSEQLSEHFFLAFSNETTIYFVFQFETE